MIDPVKELDQLTRPKSDSDIMSFCPDPYEDPEGFFLYQEMISCVACDGVGEDVDDGEAWVCPRCNGSGVDPSYEDVTNESD